MNVFKNHICLKICDITVHQTTLNMTDKNLIYQLKEICIQKIFLTNRVIKNQLKEISLVLNQ